MYDILIVSDGFNHNAEVFWHEKVKLEPICQIYNQILFRKKKIIFSLKRLNSHKKI